MAFKMNGFNPGSGTSMGETHMANSSAGSPNKRIKILGNIFNKGKKIFKKKPGKVNINTPTGPTKNTIVKAPKNDLSKAPKNTSKGPKSAADEFAMKNDLFSKLPKNTPKSKLNKAFKLLMTGWAVTDIINFVKGDDKGGDDQAIQDAVDKGAEIGGAAEAAGKAAAEAAKKLKNKKDPYADAKKNDPNLDKHIAERDKHKKGTPEYDAAQNRINKAYGDKTRHGVKKTKGTKGRDTVSRLHVPGIVDKAKLERERKIGGKKIIQQNVNLETGEHKERKTKGSLEDPKKQKERFYDAEGNLTRKTKDKKNKQKDIIKTANTVTKVKVNKRTGKVKTKTRRRRGQKTGEFFKSLVGK